VVRRPPPRWATRGNRSPNSKRWPLRRRRRGITSGATLVPRVSLVREGVVLHASPVGRTRLGSAATVGRVLGERRDAGRQDLLDRPRARSAVRSGRARGSDLLQ